MKICHPSILTIILLFHQTFASQEKLSDHFGFIQQKGSRNRKNLSRALQFDVTPDFVCETLETEEQSDPFKPECTCTTLPQDSGEIACANTCESCLENDEGVTECFLESGTTSFTIDGLTGVFNTYFCFELITDDENDGKEVCFVSEEVVVNFLSPVLEFPTAGISIDGELCLSFNLEGECATVDCSNLGYSSDWDYCDDSTYSGNAPLTQAYKYEFYPDEDLTLGTCLDDAVSASPSMSPTDAVSASPSMSPTVSSAPSKSATASPSMSPILSAAPSKSPTASPSMLPTVSAAPSKSPTASPTSAPTKSPTASPTSAPTKSPTASPSSTPSKVPTRLPTSTAIALSGSYVFSSVVAIIFLPVFL